MNTRFSALQVATVLAALAASPFLTGCVAEPVDELAGEEFAGTETPEPIETIDESVTGTTVAQAAASSCSTGSVKGLSLQIIAESRCMNADAFVALPTLSNVTWGSVVFPNLTKAARDKLVAAAKANPSRSMTINSSLRTSAQQYLLYNWYVNGRCSISLAAKPGNSNHETGLALDISQHSTWRPILSNYGFKWLGSNDPVHFDYIGAGATNFKGLTVKAFQRLWNRNNPNDTISTDGAWGPQTEARMKKSPAGGFPVGATCGAAAILPPELERALDAEDDLPFQPIEPHDDVHEPESCADGAH